MLRTKKHFAVFTVLLFGVFFILLFFFLPIEAMQLRREQSQPLFTIKVIFLSISAAISTSIGLFILYRQDFIKQQAFTFNRFKHLLRLLVKRDFVTRYRRSTLGVLWSLLNPLLTMLVLTMVFSFFFRFEIPNFPVYLLSGQIIFGFFSESTSLAMGSVISGADVIRKVYVPKYLFPLTRVLSSLVNLFFSFLAFLLVFLITRSDFHWTILLIPIPIIYTFVFSLGLGLLLSSMAVFFRDLTYLYGVFLTLLSFMTPIFYPVSIMPERVQTVIGLNPLYHFVDYFRSLVVNGIVPDLWSNIVCISFALAALCGGLYVFMSQQDRYILYI